MGDAGDLSDASYLTATAEPNLPNSQTLKYQILYIDAAGTDVTNTASETDLFSYLVAANLLGTSNLIRLTIMGTYEANSGSPTMTIRIKYGATTIWQDVTGTLGAVVTKGGWSLFLLLGNDGVLTNAQELTGLINTGARAAATTGFGDLTAGGGVATTIGGTGAEDSTTPLTLKITVQWSAANTSYHWTTLNAVVELLAI
jgi:hypothetical protein